MRVGISTQTRDTDELLRRVQASPTMVGANLTSAVSTDQPYRIRAQGSRRLTVARSTWVSRP